MLINSKVHPYIILNPHVPLVTADLSLGVRDGQVCECLGRTPLVFAATEPLHPHPKAASP